MEIPLIGGVNLTANKVLSGKELSFRIKSLEVLRSLVYTYPQILGRARDVRISKGSVRKKGSGNLCIGS